MSHRSVEQVIGRLATDEEFRRRFQENREAAVAELAAAGFELTPVEQRALLDFDFAACQKFARCLDPRIQKASVKGRSS